MKVFRNALFVAIFAAMFLSAAGWSQTIGETMAVTEGMNELSGIGTGSAATGRARRTGDAERVPMRPSTFNAQEGGEVPLMPPEVKEGDEGTPFNLNEATRFANEGMVRLRQMDFTGAQDAYREAKNINSQYEQFFQKIKEIAEAINEGDLTIEELRNQEVSEEIELTWGQFLGWDKGVIPSRAGMMPGMMPGMMGGPGMMPGMMGGPGMMPGMPGNPQGAPGGRR